MIPFGEEKNTKRLVDAGSVPNGLRCNCVCVECKKDLEAVHPSTVRIKKYFRHSVKANCTGSLESLIHKVAKQIIKENSQIKVAEGNYMYYEQCDIEKARHGNQPDAFISNVTQSMVVEIYCTHKIEKQTLNTYLQNGDKVLEINLSELRKGIIEYDELKKLILYDAPRNLFAPENNPSVKNNSPLWLKLLLLALAAFLLRAVFIRKKKKL